MKSSKAMDSQYTANRPGEAGQTLALVAVLLLGLIAVLGLVLDGGNLYLHRRRAQNAADAGAIAGARVLAMNGTETGAHAAAQEYAVARNQADSAEVTIGGGEDGNQVLRVVAHEQVATTFARILGINQLEVSAEAEAMIGPAGGSGGLAPIAIREYSYAIGQTYTIWDCDEEMDPAGHNLSGSNRGWLSLACVYPDDCTNGADDLKEWMRNGYPGMIYADDWVRPAEGTTAAAIQQAYPGQTLVMPVFRVLRDYPDSSGKPFYHIVAFAVFDVFQVHAKGYPKGLTGKFRTGLTAGPIGTTSGGLQALQLNR
jgi:hypothetical protein